MGRVVTHTEAEMAFHPWWDDMEDYLVYGLVLVGVILVPSAVVTGTPLDCNFCKERLEQIDLSNVETHLYNEVAIISLIY